ncbi:uroporphyrinogen-III C-methyltransferase [Andreprevotia chitinilytica]|uniref:uroporphyrinogen-III C-methyltransferase n=1 Tax=Andreprevotia chitinilytica TaxID=396808 RepID=UPI00054D37E2|nr:uroporphyrinogen-III C-methyltransferase [Andreprevotia chitinilytica]
MTQPEATLSAALTPSAPPRRKRVKPGIALALLALLVVGALAVWQYQSTETLKAQLAHQSELLQTAQGHEQATREQFQALQREVALLSAKQMEAQNQQATLATMYESVTQYDSHRLLGEAEQAVSYASQQLQLTGRVDIALATLYGIDGQLQSLNRPELIRVRQAITRDIDTLKTVPTSDTVGVYAKLESLLDQISALPLQVDLERSKPSANLAPVGGTWTDRVANGLLTSLKQLVEIRRMDNADGVLLTPEQSMLLRENIKLRLLDARTALLMRNEAAYKADLAAVRSYLKKYFDGQATRQALQDVDALDHAAIAIKLPDLAGSLAAVRNARSNTEKAKP